MANRERGEMRLATPTQTYTLRLTTNACVDLEDRSGKLVDEVIRGAYRGSVRDLRWLLWASLQDGHADTVKEPTDVGVIIDDAGGIKGVLAQMIAFVKLNADEHAPKEGVAPADPLPAQAEVSGVDSTSTLAASV